MIGGTAKFEWKSGDMHTVTVRVLYPVGTLQEIKPQEPTRTTRTHFCYKGFVFARKNRTIVVRRHPGKVLHCGADV
jgi:hypothetical protein